MKKIFSILALAMLLTAVPAHAQLDKGFHLGVKAGLNFSNMSAPGDAFDEGFLKTYTGFNAGLVFNFNLPLGFEFAPELLYVQSGFKGDAGEMLGVPLTTEYTSGSIRVPLNVRWGISLFDFIKPYVVVSPYVVWRFQVSFKWNWDLNPIYKKDKAATILEDNKFNGGELSLAFFF